MSCYTIAAERIGGIVIGISEVCAFVHDLPRVLTSGGDIIVTADGKEIIVLNND